MTKETGGPAFPGEQGHVPEGTWNPTWEPGMTLREWYAGRAMEKLIYHGPVQTDPQTGYLSEAWAAWIATNAFIMADAMLTERSKP